MTEPIRGLSSMATKGLLAELSVAAHGRHGLLVNFESAGGVEVVRHIRAGAQADLAVLSDVQIKDLDADGLLETTTVRPLFISDVVAAVPATRASVSIATEAHLRAVLATADRIAYSTGPSGTALIRLLERWQLAAAVRPKLVQARPGTPVASLLAGGEADLGFQQGSEFRNRAEVRVLGPLPGTAAMRSIFSGAVLARSTNTQRADTVLEWFASKEAQKYVVAAGMTVV